MVWNDCMLYVKFVCVKLMYVKFVCVKLLYVKFVCVVVCVRRREEEEKEPGIQNQKQEPHTKMSLCHACHAKRKWMSPSATPATQNAAASRPPKPGPRAPPSTISATPATQNDGRCEFVPRLPRETKVNVTKCHACHAECRGVTPA